MFWNDVGSSWIVWGILVTQKIKIVGLGRKDTFENPEIIEMRVSGFSHNQIEKLLVQSEAEYYGAFKHIFSINLS